MEIIFSDPLGKIIAQRKLSPEEYLNKNVQYSRGLKNNQSQAIKLDIIDPDPKSLLSFQFNYL